MNSYYCTKCNAQIAPGSSVCMACGSPASSQLQQPQPQLQAVRSSSNINQLANGSGKKLPKILLFILIGIVALAGLTVAGFFFSRQFFGSDADGVLEAAGMECEQLSQENLEYVQLPEIAEILQRGHSCRMSVKGDSSAMDEDWFFVRVSKSDYDAMLQLAAEDFEIKIQSMEAAVLRQVSRIRENCEDQLLGKYFSIGGSFPWQGHGSIRNSGLRVREGGSLIVDEYIFMANERDIEDFREFLDEKKVRSGLAKTFCGVLADKFERAPTVPHVEQTTLDDLKQRFEPIAADMDRILGQQEGVVKQIEMIGSTSTCSTYQQGVFDQELQELTDEYNERLSELNTLNNEMKGLLAEAIFYDLGESLEAERERLNSEFDTLWERHTQQHERLGVVLDQIQNACASGN